MSISRRQIIQAASAASFAATGLHVWAQAQLETVTIITGFAAGGTSDTTCRRVAEQARARLRQGVRGREPHRRRRPDRRHLRQEPAGRRRHDPADADLDPHDLSAHLQEAAVRPGGRPDAGDARLHLRLRLCGRPGRAARREDRARVPGLGPRPIPRRQLRLAGRRLDAALHRRAAGRERGVDLKHAAYRGTQPAMLDLLGGNISAVSGPIGDITQHLPTGKVASSASRAPSAAASRPTCRPSASRASRTWRTANGSPSSCRPRPAGSRGAA